MISGHGTNPIQKKQKRLDVYNTRYLSNPTPYFQQHLIIVLIPPPRAPSLKVDIICVSLLSRLCDSRQICKNDYKTWPILWPPSAKMKNIHCLKTTESSNTWQISRPPPPPQPPAFPLGVTNVWSLMNTIIHQCFDYFVHYNKKLDLHKT